MFVSVSPRGTRHAFLIIDVKNCPMMAKKSPLARGGGFQSAGFIFIAFRTKYSPLSNLADRYGETRANNANLQESKGELLEDCRGSLIWLFLGFFLLYRIGTSQGGTRRGYASPLFHDIFSRV